MDFRQAFKEELLWLMVLVQFQLINLSGNA